VPIQDQLRDAIANSEKSLNAIAKESGIPQPMLYNFMQGKDIRLETAAKLADYFGMRLTVPKK
jgi:predicted transcriptional regulator